MGAVIAVILTFERHFRYTAALASDAYVELAPIDFRVYIYEFGVESLLLIVGSVLLYRWTLPKVSGWVDGRSTRG